MSTDALSRRTTADDASSESSDLVLRADYALSPADDLALQRLWLSLVGRPWRSLAVMAASKGTSTLAAATHLARIARWYTGQPSCVFDMRDLNLRFLEPQIRDMAAQLQGGERVFIALRSLAENATTAPLARAADCVVLCAELGKSDIRSAKHAIATIGRERFLGTLLCSEDGIPCSSQKS